MLGFALRRSAFCGFVSIGCRASGLGRRLSFVRSGFSSVGRRLSLVSLGLRASGTELRASGVFFSGVSCVGLAVSVPVRVGSRVAGVGFMFSLWFSGTEPRASDSSTFGHPVSPVVRRRRPGVGRMSRLPRLRCPLRWCPRDSCAGLRLAVLWLRVSTFGNRASPFGSLASTVICRFSDLGFLSLRSGCRATVGLGARVEFLAFGVGVSISGIKVSLVWSSWCLLGRRLSAFGQLPVRSLGSWVSTRRDPESLLGC